MKKNLIAVALLATTAFASSAFAADGQVNFTGSITDTACTVDSSAKNLDVPLGNVASTAFAAAGDVASSNHFTLVLKDCPAAVTSAAVRFDGNQVPGDNTVLALTDGANIATGVGVQISDAQNKVVPLYTDSSSYALVSTGPNNLDFTARYISTAAKVTAGPANAVSQFTIIYP